MHANCRVANFGKTFLFLFSKVRLGDSIKKNILCIFEIFANLELFFELHLTKLLKNGKFKQSEHSTRVYRVTECTEYQSVIVDSLRLYPSEESDTEPDLEETGAAEFQIIMQKDGANGA